MPMNLNNTTPAAPTGNANVTWQVDGSGNVSAYAIPGWSLLSYSGTTATWLGSTYFIPGNTVTVGANHVLHLRAALYRNSTGTSITVCICKDTTHGYVLGAQSDGNLVNSYYDGTAHVINASGSSTDNEVGPCTYDLYFHITTTAVHGISMGGLWWSPHKAWYAWPSFVDNTSVDLTGALTIVIGADVVGSIHTVQYEIL